MRLVKGQKICVRSNKFSKIMKLMGSHMYIGILVVLVCVVLYVFYVSKDIVTLDNEVRTLKSQLGQVVQTISSRQSSHPQAPPTPSKTQVATQVDISSTREEDVEEIESVKTEHMASLLVNLQEEELEEEGDVKDEEHVVADEVAEDVIEEVLQPMQEKTVYSFQDLKDLCKKHGLHSKGTKQQLVELLKAHEIIQ
jgi:hypothetical protein